MTDTDPTALTQALAAMRSSAPRAATSSGGVASSVSVSNFPATQTVTGTVTANAGSGTLAVSAATLPLPTGAATDGTDISTPTAMPAGGAGIRGWLSAIWTKLNGTLAVSLATNTPDVTDRSARLLGTLTGVTNTVFIKADTAGNQPNALKVDASATTQPVSGTVTDNQGTPAAVGNAWPVKNTDGTNTAAVKAASTAPATTDPALVVALSPNTAVAGLHSAATWRQFATSAAAGAGTVTQGAGAAGVKNYLSGFTVSYTGAAITAGTTIQVKDNTTVIYEEYFPQSTATAGAVNRVFPAPLAGTAATAMTVNVSAGVTSVTQKVAAWGYTGP